MTALSLTYVLSNATTADATKVEQDLIDIQTYINASVIRTDGVNAMAAALSLVAGNPSNVAHAVRKDYVDGPYVYAKTGTSQAYTSGVYLGSIFTTEVTDTANAYVLATGIFTAPTDGVYAVTLGLQPARTITSEVAAEIVAGGNTFLGPAYVPSAVNSVAGEKGGYVHHACVFLTAGQTIQPKVKMSTGSTQVIPDFLTIAWLHG